MGRRLHWSHLSLMFPDAPEVTLAAWRTCVAVSSRQDIPVGQGQGGEYSTAASSGPCLCRDEPLCQAGSEDTVLPPRLCAGRAGWDPVGAAVPQGWGWPQSVGNCEPRKSCARCGREGWHKWEPLQEGSLSCVSMPMLCWHKLLGSHFGSTKMCLSEWNQVLENYFQ